MPAFTIEIPLTTEEVAFIQGVRDRVAPNLNDAQLAEALATEGKRLIRDWVIELDRDKRNKDAREAENERRRNEENAISVSQSALNLQATTPVAVPVEAV